MGNANSARALLILVEGCCCRVPVHSSCYGNQLTSANQQIKFRPCYVHEVHFLSDVNPSMYICHSMNSCTFF